MLKKIKPRNMTERIQYVYLDTNFVIYYLIKDKQAKSF